MKKDKDKDHEDEVSYRIEPHLVMPNKKIVAVFHGKSLIGTFNIHIEKERRYCVFTSKYIVNVYTDFDNPDALQVMVDLGKIK